MKKILYLLFTAITAFATASCDKGGDDGFNYPISVVQTEGGSITATIDGKPAVKANYYSEIILTAVAGKGYTFVNWVLTTSGKELTPDIVRHFIDDAKSNPATLKECPKDALISAKFIPLPKEGIYIDGVVWATNNVDAPGKFTAKPTDAGMLYLWSRRIGFSSTDPMTATNGVRIWENGDSQWDPVSEIGEVWSPENDPCPEGWRLPIEQEFKSLWKSRNEWVAASADSPHGRKFFARHTDQYVFFPAVDYRWRKKKFTESDVVKGCYWSGTGNTSLKEGIILQIMEENRWDFGHFRAPDFACSIRCVAK